MLVFKSFILTLGRIFNEFFGGVVLNGPVVGPALATVTYSASMTPELSASDQQIITVTDAVAHAINAPLWGGAAMSATNPPVAGFVWTLTIRNTSGGAAGAATFNAVFKLGAAWTQPATGFSRSITFRWNGTNHVEIGRTAADVAN